MPLRPGDAPATPPSLRRTEYHRPRIFYAAGRKCFGNFRCWKQGKMTHAMAITIRASLRTSAASGREAYVVPHAHARTRSMTRLYRIEHRPIPFANSNGILYQSASSGTGCGSSSRRCCGRGLCRSAADALVVLWLMTCRASRSSHAPLRAMAQYHERSQSVCRASCDSPTAISSHRLRSDHQRLGRYTRQVTDLTHSREPRIVQFTRLPPERFWRRPPPPHRETHSESSSCRVERQRRL